MENSFEVDAVMPKVPCEICKSSEGVTWRAHYAINPDNGRTQGPNFFVGAIMVGESKLSPLCVECLKRLVLFGMTPS